MNLYKAFYNGKDIEVKAATSIQAQRQAVALFRASKPRAYMVHVHLLLMDIDGAALPVLQSTVL